jgi:hypothetical protein
VPGARERAHPSFQGIEPIIAKKMSSFEASRQHLEPGLDIRSRDDLQDEVPESGIVEHNSLEFTSRA